MMFICGISAANFGVPFPGRFGLVRRRNRADLWDGHGLIGSRRCSANLA